LLARAKLPPIELDLLRQKEIFSGASPYRRRIEEEVVQLVRANHSLGRLQDLVVLSDRQ
jgi:hypothetical protein